MGGINLLRYMGEGDRVGVANTPPSLDGARA